MKTFLLSTAVFLGSLAIGWLSAPPSAECRSCQQRTCASQRSCGEHCTCVWPDGKDYKMGVCVRMDD